MTTTQQVAANVRAEMARSGLSQASLGTDLGLKQQSLSRRLAGRTPFSVDEAFAVADLLGVPASEIFPTSRHATDEATR
jgi:transcriptional regulator with XRE-family HTH domain